VRDLVVATARALREFERSFLPPALPFDAE